MQYQVLPSFVFGFLLTVFPRWLGEPDLDRRAAWPVGAGLFGSQILMIAGALGWRPAIILGAIVTLIGWIIGLLALARLVVRDSGKTRSEERRVGQECVRYVSISVGAVSLKKKIKTLQHSIHLINKS